MLQYNVSLEGKTVLVTGAVHDVVLQDMTNMFSGNKPGCSGFNNFCLPMSTVKQLLDTQRRNKIAHEADIQNLVSMDKTPIDRSDVDDTFVFLDQIVKAIEDIHT